MPANPGQFPDEAERVRLASRTSTTPEMLCSLAADPSVMVRAAVALNAAIAPGVDDLLMHDADERVRALLGGKIARMLPNLTDAQHAAALAHAHRTLMVLARDVALRVRCAVAEALAAMPHAPRAVILALASDRAPLVSEPVLRLSPLLTDADLATLLAYPAHEGVPTAIASRPNLAARLCEHIALHANGAAVHALLLNPSADLKEAALDGLMGRAADHPEWHDPLARRPNLPPHIVLALIRLVERHLLGLLAERPDLSTAMLAELRARLDRALDPPPPGASQALDKARRMQRDGTLTEQAAVDAASSGRVVDLTAMLAVASGAGAEGVQRALATRSAKAIASLAWKAGWSMDTATLVQSVLSDITPDERVAPAPQGGYAMSPTEMSWQFGLMTEQAR